MDLLPYQADEIICAGLPAKVAATDRGRRKTSSNEVPTCGIKSLRPLKTVYDPEIPNWWTSMNWIDLRTISIPEQRSYFNDPDVAIMPVSGG